MDDIEIINYDITEDAEQIVRHANILQFLFKHVVKGVEAGKAQATWYQPADAEQAFDCEALCDLGLLDRHSFYKHHYRINEKGSWRIFKIYPKDALIQLEQDAAHTWNHRLPVPVSSPVTIIESVYKPKPSFKPTLEPIIVIRQPKLF